MHKLSFGVNFFEIFNAKLSCQMVSNLYLGCIKVDKTFIIVYGYLKIWAMLHQWCLFQLFFSCAFIVAGKFL